MTVPELQLTTHDPDYGTEGEPRWQNEAACKGEPAAIFFPPRGDYNLHRQAVAFCDRCTVRDQCLDEHLGEPDGIFGGLGSTGRRIEARRRVAAGIRPARTMRHLQPCGTNAAYFRHRRNGEPPCQACIEAHRIDNHDAQVRYRANRKLRQQVDA